MGSYDGYFQHKRNINPTCDPSDSEGNEKMEFLFPLLLALTFIDNPIPVYLYLHSLLKTVGKVSPILVTLTSRSDSDFESSNVSLKENKPDGVNPNSNDTDYYVRKNEGKIRWFSADCTVEPHVSGPCVN